MADQSEAPGFDLEDGVRVPDQLAVLPISDAVVFPYMMVPLVLSDANLIQLADDVLADSKMLGTFTQLPEATTNGSEEEESNVGEEDVYEIGTAVVIQKMLRFPDGSMRLLGQGITRIRRKKVLQTEPYMVAEVEVLDEKESTDAKTVAYMRGVANNFIKIVDASEKLSDELKVVAMNIDEPGRLADMVATNLDIDVTEKQKVLEILDPRARLELLSEIVMRELEMVELGEKLQSRVRKAIDKDQREYYLRQQLKAIQRELGDTDQSSVELDELRERIEEASLPDHVREAALKEYDRLTRMSPGASEYTVSKTYVDWLLELPWLESSVDNLQLKKAEEVLERDHYGLEDVKERVLEYLAVKKLKDDMRGPILCLVGPPGVGKTSLGKSIAEAMGRKFYRLSLGGMRDEAEIRGHRRTYVGAMPGRVIHGVKVAGTNNPLFMLDEIDKLGSDFRGDPASALLEVLDPAQNSTFTDHYLNLPFDLSNVLFMTTANVLDTIPRPLRDRMEIIQLPGYTRLEKLEIAKRYLVPRQVAENGLSSSSIRFTDAGLNSIISDYTAEAGVRSLERTIGRVCRKVARGVAGSRKKKRVNVSVKNVHDYLGAPVYSDEARKSRPEVGVCAGLAWTPVGGKILFVEAVAMPGQGALRLTGQLGNVMQESAQAALSYIRSRYSAGPQDIEWLRTHDLHVHLPAGAIPKDGPSAGITMATALVSLYRGIPISNRVAMTGEISLTGEVHPVGGLVQKILAAHRARISQVIIPADNERDLEELPEEVLEAIEFHPVERVEQVWELALTRPLQ
ncbi:MAG TPA: endopeptidase La [Candidatus Krumholzibacteria bacterium]|nr:endopeptidase La [Candidatus Krumholzibacteria bacterium]